MLGRGSVPFLLLSWFFRFVSKALGGLFFCCNRTNIISQATPQIHSFPSRSLSACLWILCSLHSWYLDFNLSFPIYALDIVIVLRIFMTPHFILPQASYLLGVYSGFLLSECSGFLSSFGVGLRLHKDFSFPYLLDFFFRIPSFSEAGGSSDS